MSNRRATTVPGAGVPTPGRPMLTLLTTDAVVETAEVALDMDLLRAIGWGEPLQVGGPASIAVARLRRAGLVEPAQGGRHRLTPAGLDLLDDDF